MPDGRQRPATRVLYGTPWTDDTLLAREIQRNRELEARDGRPPPLRGRLGAVAARRSRLRRHVEGEIARLGEHHPIVQTQYLLRPLGRGGRFLDTDPARSCCAASTRPRTVPSPAAGPWRYVAGLDVAGEDEEDPDGLLVASQPPPRRHRPDDRLRRSGAGGGRVVEPRCGWSASTPGGAPPTAQLYPASWRCCATCWRCRVVVVDATGSALAWPRFSAPRWARGSCGLPIHGGQKSQLAYDFLAAVNAGRFSCTRPARRRPSCWSCWSKPKQPSTSLRANQTMSFFVPEAKGHDDLLNAAVLCVQAAPLAAHRIASGRRAET